MPVLWIMLFLFNLGFAIFIAVPIRSLLREKAGFQNALNRSADRFDFTFISDFLNEYGDLVSGIANHGFLVIILYLFFFVFLTGGILDTIIHRNGKFSGHHFWGHSGHYFWRMLRLMIYFGLIHLIVFILFALFFAQQGINPLKMETDDWIIGRARWMIPLLLLVHIIIAMVHDFIKVAIVQTDAYSMHKMIRERSSWIFRHFFSCFGLYLINIIVAGLFLLIHRQIQMVFPGVTAIGILLSFLVAQVFIFLRVGFKLVNFASINALYHKDSAITE